MRRPRTAVLISTALTLGTAPLLLAGCIYPSPSPRPNAQLREVAAVNTSNVWAVGNFVDRSGQHDLMEHWNGKNWQEVFLPPPFGTSLSGITAVNASNIWAVGGVRTLHFNGISWRSIGDPGGITVGDVASGSDAAVYGLGESVPIPGIPPADQSLAHYGLLVMTPANWRSVSAIPTAVSLDTCDISGDAEDLSVVKANDVWVVGNGTLGSSTTVCTRALHWNGSTWQSAAMPATTGSPRLYAVSARAANDVWAVGAVFTMNASHANVENSLVMHWNGAKWAVVPSPDSRGDGYLKDVDATAEGVWAVGAAMSSAEAPQDIMIKKWTGTSMADQSTPDLPPFANFTGVSVADGAVTSVGWYQPRSSVVATLTDRRNAS